MRTRLINIITKEMNKSLVGPSVLALEAMKEAGETRHATPQNTHKERKKRRTAGSPHHISAKSARPIHCAEITKFLID